MFHPSSLTQHFDTVHSSFPGRRNKKKRKKNSSSVVVVESTLRTNIYPTFVSLFRSSKNERNKKRKLKNKGKHKIRPLAFICRPNCRGFMAFAN